MADNISELYQVARKKGVLANGLTEDMFREQTATDEGLQSFYKYASTHGMKLRPWNDFRAKARGEVIQQTQERNPRVKDFPAPTNEAEYQENKRRQESAQDIDPALQNINIAQEQPQGEHPLQTADDYRDLRLRMLANQMQQQLNNYQPNVDIPRQKSSLEKAQEAAMQQRRTDPNAIATRMLRDTYKEINSVGDAVEPQPEQQKKQGFWQSIGSHNPYPTGVGQQQDPYVRAARNLLLQAETRMADTKKGEYQFGDYSKNTIRHLLTSQEGIASFGLSNLQEALLLKKVFEKVNTDEAIESPESVLNKKELALYNAYVTTLAAEFARANDTSAVATAGKITADMIQFVEEMAMQSGLWGKLNSTVRKQLTRKLTEQIIAKTSGRVARGFAKAGTGLILNATERGMLAGETAVTSLLLPRTYANMVGNEIGVANTNDAIQFDGYKLRIGEFETNTTADAFLTSWRDQWKEMFTETGGLFKFGSNILFKNPLARTAFNKLGKTKFGSFLDGINRGMNKAFPKYAKTVMYDGVFNEWLEEQEGACWDYLFGDKNAFKNFYSKEQQIPMLISFGAPALFGAGVNVAQETYFQKKYDNAIAGLQTTLYAQGYNTDEVNEFIMEIKDNLYATDVAELPKTIQQMAASVLGNDAVKARNRFVGRYEELADKKSLTKAEQEEFKALEQFLNNDKVQMMVDCLSQLAGAETALASMNRQSEQERNRAIERARQAERDYGQRPIGTSDWGAVYNWQYRTPQEGADFLMQAQSGYLRGVFHSEKLGDVDMTWGHYGAGLLKMIEKHIIRYSDFDNVEELVSTLDNLISNYEPKQNNQGRWEFTDGEYIAVVATDENGQWVLTSYDKVHKSHEKARTPEEQEAKRKELGIATISRPDETANTQVEEEQTLLNTENPEEISTDKITTNNSNTQVFTRNNVPVSRENLLLQNRNALQPLVHIADNNTIYQVQDTADPNKKGYIVNGDVSIDTQSEQPRLQGDGTVVVKWELPNGEYDIKQVNIKDLDLVSAQSAEAAANALTDQQWAAIEAQQRSEQTYFNGQKVEIVMPDNSRVPASVVNITDEGVEVVFPDANHSEGYNSTIVPHQDAATHLVPLEQAEPTQTPQPQEQPQAAPEPTSTPTPQPTPQAPDPLTMQAEQLGASAVEFMGSREDAVSWLDMQIALAQKTLKAAQNQKPKSSDAVGFRNEITQIRQAQQAAQAQLDKLNEAKKQANRYRTQAELAQEQAEQSAEQPTAAEQPEGRPASPQTESAVPSAQGSDGQVEPTDKQGNPLNSDGTLKLEQVESIDQLTDEDFTKPSRSVQLPELAKPVNDAIGAKGKPVVIKKNIFEKNLKAHAKLTPEDSRKILNTALYNPNLYGQNQKTTRPNNWILIHIAETNTAVLLEVAENKDNVEIISWHYLDDYGIQKKQNQAIKEGGQILKFSTNPVADTANDDLISADKDTTNSATTQEESEKKSQKQPKEQPKQERKNTIFTEEEAERVRARMRARRNRLNMGIDPEQFADGVFMAGYYVENGMRKFADFARAMIKEFGDWVRPYLKQWYMGLRYDPRAVGQEFLKDMDDINTVDKFDVDNFKVDLGGQTEQSQNNSEKPLQNEKKGVILSAEEPTAENPNRVIRYIGEIRKSKHTQTGEDLWIVNPTDRVSDAEFKQLKARARNNNGYYSSFKANKGFIFKSEEDANNFNNIEDERTTDETAANTTAIAEQGQAVATEAAAIERDRRDSSETAGELGTESPTSSVGAVGTVEQTPEQAEEEITTRQKTIDKIDQAVEKHDNQLALLGYYEADQSGNFHETYGYRRSAELKAVADADRLAKQLAEDLGIKLESKRKKLATANIPPTGGEITFRLPLENGNELFLQIGIAPNESWRAFYRQDGSEDDLHVTGLVWRIENPSKNGSSRYVTDFSRFAMAANGFNLTYRALLQDIRTRAKNYLPQAEIAPNTTKKQIVAQAVEKQKKRKADKTAIQDNQQILGLFADAVEDLNSANTEESTPEQEVQPINTINNGDTEVRNDGQRESRTPQRRSAGQPADENGTLGGSQRQTDEGTDTRGVGARGEQHRLHDGERGLGTFVLPTKQIEERPESLIIQYRDKYDVPHTISATYYKIADAYHLNEENTNNQANISAKEVLRRIKKGFWKVIYNSSALSTNKNSDAPIAESERRNTRNFRYDPNDPAPTSNKARYEANLAAIRLLKELQAADRQATPEEQRVLAKFTGWGGLGEFFKGEPGTTYYSQHGEQSPYQTIKALLTDEEMEAAQLSRNSAYYTPAPVIDTLWDVAKRLGFKGGNILEGSAGIGNILAQMPQGISDRSQLQAVEIDPITAGILEQLYPDAQTHAAGFQEVNIPNNSQDLVITNVPFVTGLRVYDKQEKDISKRFGNIHDFCIAKNVRKLKQGGLGIFITSSGTLDSSKDLRRWLNTEGDTDVIGAFRMNRETFGGTSVTSDIIVVRKRVNGQKDPRAIDVLDTMTDRVAKQEQEETWNRKKGQWETPEAKEVKLVYNKYFVEHPEAMGGVMGFGFEHGDTRWGGTTAGCYADPTIDQNKRLQQWVESLNVVGDTNETVPTIREEKQDNPLAQYEYTTESHTYGELILNSKGQICKFANGYAVPVEGINPTKVKGHTKAEVLKDYNAIKSALDELLTAQTKDISDAELKPYLQKLNSAYNAFTRKYGNLNRNVSLSFLRNDVQWASIAALEDVKETVDANGKKKVEVSKTDVFTKRVVGVMPQPKAETAKDGVILSVQQFGVIRPDKIAEWLNKPAEEVEREIIESRLGFKDPQTGNIQVRHEYLSGNVREKLAYAEEHNENGEYDTNIDELRKVIPIDIPAHLIEFNIGSTWIPTELYQEYLKDKFDVTGIKLTHIGSAWVAGDLPWSGINEKNRSEGVYSEKLGEQVYGSDLMIAAMNNVPLIVSRTEKHRDGTTETITDKEATAACSDKISQIKDDFVEWARGKMQQDSELAERVQKIYNDRFNAIVPMMKVDDIFLSEHLPGQNHKYELYKHQQNAVVRATTQPIMLAHEVGTGKTITLISTAMEMRRLGTAKKPMIVVQNATTQQFVKEAKDLYPNAKILTVSERDRTREGRQEFYAKIKYNDWDLIIVPQSVFDMIPDSESRMRDFINEKIEEKIHAIEAAKEAGLDQKITNRMEKELENLREDLETNNMSGKRGKKATEKDAKKAAEQRANAEARAQAMLDRKTDDVADFDDMGIDALLIDEAHNYKHLGFSTMMTRGVKGIDPSYSKRAAALYLKCQSVYERCGHRNVVFATGTPISNTAAEIWTFMKYLLPKEVLKENDIYYFDDFVHNFGKINEQLEFQTNGKFKPNNRFSQYGNVPELMRMWLSCADCVLTREVGQVNNKVPEIENGGAQDIFLPQSPSLIDIMATVRAELERYEQMSGKEKKENSHIPLTMYGIAKRAAIDPRLVDANAADEPLSKTNKAVEEVLRSLNDSKKYNGTAAIFCDSYQNKQSGFNLFQDIKDKLVKNGVPASKIAIIRSDMTDAAKQKIFDAVREGEIRVIMGSTQTLGTGVNIQTRLHTLIHMDAPDRPMDYTQRNGRIVRQGNMHKQWGIPVRILRFGVEDSLDVTSYQRLKTKAGFIDSIMNGKSMIDNNLENRVLEDVEEGIFDNPVAMLSGSQYALLKTQAERDLRKWSARKQQHNIDQILIAKRLKDNALIIKNREQKIAANEKFLQQLEQTFPGGKVSEYNIDGTVCHTPEEVKAALKEINKEISDRSDALRKDVYGDKQQLSYNITMNGMPFNVDVLLTRKLSWKDGQKLISIDKEVQYGAAALGGAMLESPTKVIDRLIDMIQEDILSGKQARGENQYSKSYIERLQKENELMREREGKPFAHEEELQKAQQLVDEYTEKMKEELAAKEAKYANLASGKKVELNEETDEEETDTPEAQYDELDYSGRELTEAERLAAQADVESLLNNAGLQVTLDADEANLQAQKKSLLEIATWSAELSEHANKAADISTNDGAKILQKIETTKQKVENQSTKSIKNPVSFISDVLGLQQSSSSYYGTYKTKQGDIVTLRVSNHNATVSNFDNVGEQDGVSIVISNRPSNGITNDGNAHIIEYFYRKADILKAEGTPIADILGSIKGLLETGEYHDTTGLAQVQEVNPPAEMQTTEFSIRQVSPTQKQVATDVWNKYQYDGDLESIRDVAEYLEENMPQDENTTALFDAIDKWRKEEEEDRLYYGERGDLEPFEDAILDEVERLMNVKDSEREPMKAGGRLFGWAQGNHIHLTKDGFNPNTPVHEYSHLWIKAIKQNNAELYNNLMDLFSRKNLPQMYEELDNDTNYADLTEEGKMSEVFARFSGKRGAERMTEEAQAMLDDAVQNGTKNDVAKTATLIQRMKALLKKAWDWIGEHLFNINNFGSREEAADRALYDMINGTDLNLDSRDTEREFHTSTPPTGTQPTTPFSRSEIITKTLVENAKENHQLMWAALRKVSSDLKTLQTATRMQADLDRNQVASLLNLTSTLMRSQQWGAYMPNTMATIATQIRNAVGKADISKEVNKIMDYIVDAQLKVAKAQCDKLRATKIDKLNISGVVSQGKVAVQGQHALKALNEALYNHLTANQLEEQIADLTYQAAQTADSSLKAQYEGRRIGYMLAADYQDRVETLQQERQQLTDQLAAARADRTLKGQAKQELIDSLQRALRENNLQQAEAYTQSAQNLQDYIAEQHSAAKDFIAEMDANREKIRGYAAKDLAGIATNPNRLRTKQGVLRQMFDAFASPIRDLQSLLRMCGLHAPDGEGYLYNHFMRRWTDNADEERRGIVAAQQALDSKIQELTNGKYKTWEQAANDIKSKSRKMFPLTMFNGEDSNGMPIEEEIPLDATNALYIYAVNKMEDGKMKLRARNISEQDVKALKEQVENHFGKEIIAVVDWIQSEYFSQLRNRYNPTHEALFGAPMDAIENYFPLVINPNVRQKNEDLGNPDTDAARLLTGTSTGAIKRRTKNQLPLDVRNADFFQQVIRHIAQMERWNAFAQWNRDANILFSDINFRNRIKGMNTIYGTGDALYNYMKDAFKTAMGTYQPKSDAFSTFTLNAAKGVTAAKINFRVFTALKQLASFPAFFTYMTDGVFVKSYMRNWLTPHTTMQWAKQTLPNFEKRINKRDLGDMRLMQRTTDWQWNKEMLEWSQRYGMAANVFFDTLTCATGARAVYDSRLADYLEKGYTQEQAQNRARQDAEQAFNTSQQSSEGAYMAPVQMDRNIVTAALTVFRTSPIQYTRNFIYHTRNLLRKTADGAKQDQIAFRAEQYRKDGLTDEQAQRAAEMDYKKSIRADIVGVVVYGALLNILWRLAAQVPYLLFGDDDDKKKELLKDAATGGALVSPLTGLMGGGIVENAIDGYGDISDIFAPEMPFTQDIKKATQYLKNDRYAEFASQCLSVLMQSGAGFDPQTAADIVMRTITTLDSEQDLTAAEEAIRVSQALLSIPQGQYEQMLIDRVVENGDNYDSALADYQRYQAVHTAPLTWYMRNSDAQAKTDRSAKTRFNRLLKERNELRK